MTGEVKITLGTIALLGSWMLTNYDKLAAAFASLCLAAWFLMQMYYKWKKENSGNGSESGE